MDNKLEQYFADDAATEALSNAEHDPDAAWDALTIASGYMERGEVLPGNLASHLVKAIKVATEAPGSKRVKALTDALFLTAKNKRPAGNWLEIAIDANDLIKAGNSQEESFFTISDQQGISERTVRRCWEKFAPVIEEFESAFPPVLD